jgi:hypothetical protein
VPLHGKCIASHEFRAGPGVLPTKVGTIWPTEANAQVLRQFYPTRGGIKIYFEWRRVALQVRL